MQQSAASLGLVRAQAPLVHCITNYVAMNISANTLLAGGASPAMVHSPEEAGEFVSLAGALSVNMGTPSPDWVAGMLMAVEAASTAGTPWVLDPVAHMATAYRRRIVGDLLKHRPTVIRANASEILALDGVSSRARGVDAGDRVEDAQGAARRLATAHGCVVAVTGETDFISDGQWSFTIRGGSSWMPRVTAMGCSLSAFVAAMLAVNRNALEATVAALDVFKVCGAIAHEKADGPGSFQVSFLDQLAGVGPEEIEKHSMVEPA